MTTRQDLTPVLREWLEDRADMVRDPYSGFDALIAQAAVTPQRRHRWWRFLSARRPDRWRDRRQALSLALTLGAVLVVGTVFLFTSLWAPDRSVVTQPGASPTPWVSPEPPPAEGRRPRTGHTATTLPDGSVVLIGGFSGADFDDSDGGQLRAAERYDPAERRFKPAGSSGQPHSGHTATLLDDGRVLILGGYAGQERGRPVIYEPSTETFTSEAQFSPPPDPEIVRVGHTATRLLDDTVLIIGGADKDNDLVSTASILDLSTGEAEPTGSMTGARAQHTATLLPDGRVLVIGGIPLIGQTHESAEVWDPATGLFSSAGSLIDGRSGHTATLLRDGRVLVLGGYAEDPNCLIILGFRLTCGEYEFLRTSAEIWDPETSEFSEAGQASESRAEHTTTVLSDGRLLIVGGVEDSGVTDPPEQVLASATIFDPADWGLARGSALSESP